MRESFHQARHTTDECPRCGMLHLWRFYELDGQHWVYWSECRWCDFRTVPKICCDA